VLKIKDETEIYAWLMDTERASFSAYLNLYSDWRDIQNRPTLNLGASGEFIIPPSDYKSVTGSDLFFMESLLDSFERGHALPERVSIPFELSLYFTQSDPDNINSSVLSAVIPKFMPDPRELQGVVFSDEMVKDARLWLGNELNYEPTLKAIKFGKIENHKIHMVVDIDIETKNGTCAAGMNLWLPLQFYFRAGVYSDDFEGLSSAERFTEIKQCFLDYYNIEDYDLEERVINADKKEVMTRFVLKSSAS